MNAETITDFQLSDAAKRRIAYILQDEPQGTVFRISVMGGGCSGFQYHFDLEQESAKADDIAFGDAASPVRVDETSLQFLKGSQLDFVENLGSSAFEINNPNATASCGCGNSFSVGF